ncbi:TMEM175 family protein [Streptomyces flaveolus]|uniref:TMEM175 family protein n=1 Tax=Streptomyces flaveolus TaxID=67297 RepID=A0ABV1VIJ1_9ACTN
MLAIAATVLVLEIHDPAHDKGGPARALLEQWPSCVGYLASFACVAVIWLNHRQAFARSGRWTADCRGPTCCSCSPRPRRPFRPASSPLGRLRRSSAPLGRPVRWQSALADASARARVPARRYAPVLVSMMMPPLHQPPAGPSSITRDHPRDHPRGPSRRRTVPGP